MSNVGTATDSICLTDTVMLSHAVIRRRERSAPSVGRWMIMLAGLCLLGGCGSHQRAVLSDGPAQIQWFKGSMDAALSQASVQHKPLLVFWGAVWCPYCQALKKTVFTRRDFIEKTALFIPVYLDGDLPGAQQWGERLKVTGYPTLLVLRADQTEIARLSGGMDLTQYATIIDEALRDERPIQSVLGHAQSADDCHRLAYYGWDTDALEGLDSKQLEQLLADSSTTCKGADQVRLEIEALSFALQDKSAAGTLNAQVLALNAQLDRPQELQSSVDLLAGLDDSLFELVKAQGTTFEAQFRTRWVALMSTAADNPNFGAADRLVSYASVLDVTKALSIDHTVPPILQAAARERIHSALSADDRAARGDVVNAVEILLDVMGDEDGGRALYLQELPNTPTPYYYMSHLAAMAEHRGQRAEAVDWLSKAYAAAQGPATRLRWGSAYVRGLLRMAPDDLTDIRIAGLEVLAEPGFTDTLQDRPGSPIARMTQALHQWATTPQRRRIMTEIAAHLSPAGVAAANKS
jgi:thiol-disulfide isomerase/thioredoxin